MPEPAPPSPWLWLLVPLLFAVIFPLFWCFVLWLISQMGWQRVAASYAATVMPEGRVWSGQYGMVGLASYKGTLRIQVAESGLFLENQWPFRIAHRRLFIPWVDMHNIHIGGFSLFREMASFEVGSPKIATIRIPAEILREAGKLPPKL